MRRTILRQIQQVSSASFHREIFTADLQVIPEVLSLSNESTLVKYFTEILKRKKYEGNHWDDVISQYKEMELQKSSLPVEVENILSVLRNKIIDSQKKSDDPCIGNFLEPHVIDLSKSGHIAPHVDSVKFSGDLIAGVSLFSLRTMILMPSNGLGDPILLPLAPRSLYILRRRYRYEYTHEIIGPDTIKKWPNISEIQHLTFDRRISVIFRNNLKDS
mmetsp:Transcript_11683/g.17559  ORF Transcript_11683/g.17559 Transcript_11683/m.17559 type:complete len:217 (+) Transcript_11683:17-667(+)